MVTLQSEIQTSRQQFQVVSRARLSFHPPQPPKATQRQRVGFVTSGGVFWICGIRFISKIYRKDCRLAPGKSCCRYRRNTCWRRTVHSRRERIGQKGPQKQCFSCHLFFYCPKKTLISSAEADLVAASLLPYTSSPRHSLFRDTTQNKTG